MANSKPNEPKAEGGIEIDYDHLDVADLMARIQGKLAAPTVTAEDTADGGALRAASRPQGPRGAESGAEADAESGFATDSEEFEEPLPEAFLEPPLAAEPTPGFEPRGLKQKIKRILLKLMKPFFPIIRLLGLPLHQDIRETQKSLHATDLRLDRLDRLFHRQDILHERVLRRLERLTDRRFQQIELRYDQRLRDIEIAFDEKMDAAWQRQDQRHEKIELRLDLLEPRIKDLDRSMEYIRLLHNLDHNLVVELTKLKVELETLKSKFRILEKDQEYLKSRERALEEKALG